MPTAKRSKESRATTSSAAIGSTRPGVVALRAGPVPPLIGFTLNTDDVAGVQTGAGELSTPLEEEAIEFPGVDFILSIGPFGEMLEARIDNDRLSLR